MGWRQRSTPCTALTIAFAATLAALAAACGDRPPAPAPDRTSGGDSGRVAAGEPLAPLRAAFDGDFPAAAAAAGIGSPLRAELERATRAPPAWLARLRGADLAAAERLPFDPLLELALLPGPKGRDGESGVVALRRASAAAPWQAAAVATIPALSLFDGLAPVEGEFPASTTRRLVLLLDGLLRTVFSAPDGDLAEFVSADAAPFGERPGWPPFLCGIARDAAPITASIATFTVRAQSRAALLAAARIERIAATESVGGVDVALEPARGSECLVLYRPLSPRISGTAWGVAWIMEVGESGAE